MFVNTVSTTFKRVVELFYCINEGELEPPLTPPKEWNEGKPPKYPNGGEWETLLIPSKEWNESQSLIILKEWNGHHPLSLQRSGMKASPELF